MPTALTPTIEIITEKEDWDSLIDSCEHSDLYHTYDYHQLSKNGDEKAVLVKYKEKDHTIAFPLLIRKIDGTSFKDATSVYGYPGPLAKSVCHGFDNSTFRRELQKLFMENNIVSVFSRMNPLLPCQEVILKGFGAVVAAGEVVNIDLTQSLENQQRAYQRRLKTYVNKARRLCTVKKVETEEEVQKFIEMYYENMHRVNAKKNYFFAREYFYDLLKSTSFKAEILLTVHNETKEIVSGAMFIKHGGIVQYHLSGTRAEYLYLNPVKLMIDEMRIIATKENYTYFNLGGGVGSKRDNLFNFKSGFSKDFKTFKIWKYIANIEVYGQLIEEKQHRACAKLHEPCEKFFPCYRCEL